MKKQSILNFQIEVSMNIQQYEKIMKSPPMKTPIDWLKTLHQTLMSARCRIHSKEVSFEEGLNAATRVLDEAFLNRASVWWAGNGGSAAICSHLSQDVLNKLKIRSLYTGDAALMTCMANDFGYAEVYTRPLKAFFNKGDVLIAISSSGNSENIVSCVRMANEDGLHVISLSGMKDTNKLYTLSCDVAFFVESSLYGIVETGHEAILHGIIEMLWLNRQVNPDQTGVRR